jgi:hypothetical protein
MSAAELAGLLLIVLAIVVAISPLRLRRRAREKKRWHGPFP